MLDLLLKYLKVYALSMVKFIGGPLSGSYQGLGWFETALLTTMGMMTTIYLFTTPLGKKIHLWFLNTFYKQRKLFTKKNRRKVKIWRAYGLQGVAFLTPILLTPIGGALVATSFGGSRKKILLYMLISGFFWAVTFSLLIPLLGSTIKQTVLTIF